MTTNIIAPPNSDEGWRKQKREQTRQRIAEAGLRLFLEHGFEETTLDAIAEEAGIARRTFFHYFESKEALLFAYEDELERGFRSAIARTQDGMQPFTAMKSALFDMVGEFSTDEARILDRLVRSTDALRARKQANYERMEKFVYAALGEKWPNIEQLRLRMFAMIGIGIIRIAADQWSIDNSDRDLRDYLHDGFKEINDQGNYF